MIILAMLNITIVKAMDSVNDTKDRRWKQLWSLNTGEKHKDGFIISVVVFIT